MLLTLAATLALLQNPAADSPDTFVEEVRTLTTASDNDGRFTAVTELLRARKIPFTVEPFTSGAPGKDQRTQGRNIVVSLGGGSEQIVIGAHYDAVPLPDGTLSRGAVDNAASSVMLVHLAATLRTERLRMRVRLVWFDMEESGLVGSARYVQAHPSDRIRAMVNYDINAYGDTVLFGPPPGGDDARLRRTFLETCAREHVDCLRFNGMPTGDDRSFGKTNIPTLSMGILPAVEAHQLWLMLHAKSDGLTQGFAPPIFRTIHTPGDVLEKVDGATIARVHRLAVAFVRQMITTLRQ